MEREVFSLSPVYSKMGVLIQRQGRKPVPALGQNLQPKNEEMGLYNSRRESSELHSERAGSQGSSSNHGKLVRIIIQCNYDKKTQYGYTIELFFKKETILNKVLSGNVSHPQNLSQSSKHGR